MLFLLDFGYLIIVHCSTIINLDNYVTMLISVVLTLFFNFLLSQTVVQVTSKFGLYLIRKRKKKEPDVSRIVLQIVYRQALVWAGTFFCPIVPILGLLAQCLVFGLNYLIITVTCKAPTKRFKEGIIFFKGCLIFTLFCLLVPITTVFAS